VQPAAPPNLPDNDPWRRDFEAFRANFLANRDGTVTLANQWDGMVKMLDQSERAKMYYEQLVGRAANMTPTSYLSMSELEQAGEFEWEATIAQQPGGDVAWHDVFNLPPLPAPLGIEFRLDDERDAGAWQQLKVGDRVRFTGRLIGFAGQTVWVAAIRFPDPSQSAAPATPASDYASPPADPRGR
jgi:hypothetical protein